MRRIRRLLRPAGRLARAVGIQPDSIRAWLWPIIPYEEVDEAPPGAASIRVVRCGPIVTPDMLPGEDGDSINVPSLIKVPDWVKKPLGRYYLYFGSHNVLRADYIRMAYADIVTGPYKVHEPGVLSRSDIGAVNPMARQGKGVLIAPDAIVDTTSRTIRLYYSGPPTEISGRQSVYVAVSDDGLRFTPLKSKGFGPSYSRVFKHGDWYYGIFASRNQRIYRSKDGLSGFRSGQQILSGEDGIHPYARHVALQKAGDVLRVYYTRKRDAPERILLGTIDLRQPWRKWKVAGGRLILRPSTPYEGADLPLIPSEDGPARNPENALRDPFVYEEDGRVFLLYAIAGESGIAIAELFFDAGGSFVRPAVSRVLRRPLVS